MKIEDFLMKKILFIILLSVLILLFFLPRIEAANSTLEFTTTSKRIQPGDVFKATIAMSNVRRNK